MKPAVMKYQLLWFCITTEMDKHHNCWLWNVCCPLPNHPVLRLIFSWLLICCFSQFLVKQIIMIVQKKTGKSINLRQATQGCSLRRWPDQVRTKDNCQISWSHFVGLWVFNYLQNKNKDEVRWGWNNEIAKSLWSPYRGVVERSARVTLCDS